MKWLEDKLEDCPGEANFFCFLSLDIGSFVFPSLQLLKTSSGTFNNEVALDFFLKSVLFLIRLPLCRLCVIGG